MMRPTRWRYLFFSNPFAEKVIGVFSPPKTWGILLFKPVLFLRVRCFHLRQREQKLEFFYSRKKAQDVCWGEVLCVATLRLCVTTQEKRVRAG